VPTEFVAYPTAQYWVECVRPVSAFVNGLDVPLPATSVGLVSAAFVAYLKPVAVTALPPFVNVAFSVAAVAVTEEAVSVSTVGAAHVVKLSVSPGVVPFAFRAKPAT
jgi:hypothetical protein